VKLRRKVVVDGVETEGPEEEAAVVSIYLAGTAEPPVWALGTVDEVKRKLFGVSVDVEQLARAASGLVHPSGVPLRAVAGRNR